jgi:putative addiction module component (TIGR02574 family)
MALTVDELAKEAMQLPVELRAELADKLVESLDLEGPDEAQQLWVATAMRRLGEVRSGQVKPVAGEQVLENVRRSVGR